MSDIPTEVRAMKTSDLIATIAAAKAAQAASRATIHSAPIGGYVSKFEREARQLQYDRAAAHYAACCAELDARIPPRDWTETDRDERGTR